MKGRRIAFELLELYDWQGVERRLERQAAKGWRLEKIVSPFWYYRRAKPAQVRYAVTYLPNVGEATPRPDPRSAGAGRRMHGRRLGKDLRLERDADLF